MKILLDWVSKALYKPIYRAEGQAMNKRMRRDMSVAAAILVGLVVVFSLISFVG